MSSFLELHRSYNTSTGTFKNKRDADEVTARLRMMMDCRFHNFNPLAIECAGKRGNFHVNFPRIQFIWHPTELTVQAIAQEVTVAARLFAEVYEVIPQGEPEL